MNLLFNHEKRMEELLDICHKYCGEYRESHHGSGSWATSYSAQFIDATAEMFLILKKSGSKAPLFDLSKILRDADIASCRGSIMNSKRIEYLYNEHIKSVIRYRINIQKPRCSEKAPCPFCKKEVAGLLQHINAVHPDIADKGEKGQVFPFAAQRKT